MDTGGRNIAGNGDVNDKSRKNSHNALKIWKGHKPYL